MVIASLGHTDQLVICDAGLPLPREAEIVDLALVPNVPRFIDTLKAVLEELIVEKAILAKEIESINNGILKEVKDLLKGVPIEYVSHEEFKNIYRESDSAVFVRSGETSPYANIILISGVDF
jgi:D-ribose pyranase